MKLKHDFKKSWATVTSGLGAAASFSEGSRACSEATTGKVTACRLRWNDTCPGKFLSCQTGKIHFHSSFRGRSGRRYGEDLRAEFLLLQRQTMTLAPSVIVVIIQLGEHRFAAFVRENSLLFGEKCHLLSHFGNNVLINFVASGLHFISDAHF